MKGKKIWEIGGFVAGAVLIVFGAVAIFMGVSGYQTVHDELNQQAIVGSEDMTPSAIKTAAQEAGLPSDVALPTCTVAGQTVDTGAEARCFAQYMRIHTLEATGGLAYAQMGRYQSAAKPADPAGTNDETAAAKDTTGQPVSNGARNIWINETALTTALNVSYMAERLAVFGLVVGIALLLSGVGFVILALAVFGRELAPEPKRAPVTTQAAAS
jgi:hypothetical protein